MIKHGILDPGPKLLAQSGLLNNSVCSFLELQLFLIMEPNARKYAMIKVQRFLLTLKDDNPGYFQKRTSTVNVNPKNEIYVIDL